MLISVHVKSEVLARIEAVAAAQDRTRHYVLRKCIEAAFPGTPCKQELEGMAFNIPAGATVVGFDIEGPGIVVKPAGNRTATGIERMIESKRVAHDPKTCRIYRCGMCASK